MIFGFETIFKWDTKITFENLFLVSKKFESEVSKAKPRFKKVPEGPKIDGKSLIFKKN